MYYIMSFTKYTFFVSLVFAGIISSAGCSGALLRQTQNNEDNYFYQPTKILDKDKLRAGGDIFVYPFLPGEDIPANKEVKRLGLRIIQGVSEAVIDQPGFAVVGVSETEQADFFIKGYITEINDNQGITKWIPGQSYRSLEIRSRMINRESGKTVLRFIDRIDSHDQAVDLESLAKELGFKMGRLITSQTDSS